MAVVDRWDAYNRRYKLGKYKPKPPVRQTNPYSGPPRPPNAAAYPFPEFEERSEAEWQALLDARVKPYETAIKKVNTQQLGQSEFKFEQAAAANKALGIGFANLFTGGKAGAEGQQFAKENFGGELMGMQAVAIASQHLTELTNDWDERDWAISTEYQKAMAEIPGLKEQMRESIYRQDTDEYTRNFNYVNLMLDEAWNAYDANAKQWNTDQQLLAAKKMAAEQAGLVGYRDRKDADTMANRYDDQTGTVWKVVKNKDGSFSAVDTKKPKPKGATSGPSKGETKSAALSDAKWRTENGKTVWVPKVVNGTWVAVDTGRPKPPKAATAAQTNAEAELATKVQVDWREQIVGKEVPNPNWYGPEDTAAGVPKTIKQGGMTYTDAKAWLYRIVKPQFRNRSDAWINTWIRDQLRIYFPAEAAKPRGG